MVGDWIARHPMKKVMEEFEAAEAAVAPIYDIRDVLADPQYQALDSIITVPDEELGPIRMQNVMFRLSATPGQIRFAGRKVGADTEAVLSECLGIDPERVAELRAKGAL